MNKETTIEDPSVLNVIKKFTNKMINQYMKMYTGINTDFKFDLTTPVVQVVTKKWLGEVYNLRGVTTGKVYHLDLYRVE